MPKPTPEQIADLKVNFTASRDEAVAKFEAFKVAREETRSRDGNLSQRVAKDKRKPPAA